MSIEQKIAQILAESQTFQDQSTNMVPVTGNPSNQNIYKNKFGTFYRVPEDTSHLDDVLEHDDWDVNPQDVHHDVKPHNDRPITFIYNKHQDVPEEDETYLDDTDNVAPSEVFVHNDTNLSPEITKRLQNMNQKAQQENVSEANEFTRPETLERMAKDKDLNKIKQVVRNPNTSPETLERMAKDNDPTVKNKIRRDWSDHIGRKKVSEDYVNALIGGENLTEEFKEKAATIFEAAVIDRVQQEVESLEEAYKEELENKVESIVEGLVEKVDGYLDYVVEQWIEQNEIALERGMKSEILESFVGGLKSLFEDHNIEIPDEKFDVVADLSEQVEELQSKLNEQLAENVQMKTSLKEAKLTQDITEVITNLSEGLVATDKEKFSNLVADMEYDSFESFEKKAQIIRESYFTNKAATGRVAKSVVTDSLVSLTEENGFVAPEMRAYTAFLNNQTK